MVMHWIPNPAYKGSNPFWRAKFRGMALINIRKDMKEKKPTTSHQRKLAKPCKPSLDFRFRSEIVATNGYRPRVFKYCLHRNTSIQINAWWR